MKSPIGAFRTRLLAMNIDQELAAEIDEMAVDLAVLTKRALEAKEPLDRGPVALLACCMGSRCAGRPLPPSATKNMIRP